MKKKQRRISYRSDAAFKYVFGQNDEDSSLLRRILVRGATGMDIGDSFCANPELVPEMIRYKTSVLDVLIEAEGTIIDIEMQDSPSSAYLLDRFQYYHSRLVGRQLVRGDRYDALKDVYQIVLLNDERAKGLIREHALGIAHPLVHMVLVSIPCIEKEARRDAFGAMMRLMHRGNLEGIEYEDEGGIIEKMEKRYERFVMEPAYDAAMYREVQRVNLEAMKESEIREASARALSKGRLEGHSSGLREGITYSIMSIMTSQGVDCEMAMGMLRLTEEQKNEYRRRLIKKDSEK